MTMGFEELVKFLRDNWPTIIATAVIVTPVLWLILHFLFKDRLELLKGQNEALRQQNDALSRQREQLLRSGVPANREDLIDTIAEWTRIVYEIKSRSRRAMDKKEPWPGASRPLVERENTLYTKILAGLDRSYLAQDQLTSEIKEFRDLNDVADWSERRDRLMGTVSSALRLVK